MPDTPTVEVLPAIRSTVEAVTRGGGDDGERAALRAEVEAAARWFHDAGQTSGADNERYGNGEYFDAAWSRYQQERKEP